jgi:hypothetical protein
MFADLSSNVRNTAEIWHQRHQVSHVSHDLVIVTFSAVNVARSLTAVGFITGRQGRASFSEDALWRNAAVAARLSSIRQS